MSTKKNITVVIACKNSGGEPEFIATTVNITQDEYDNGDHYDLATDKVIENNYEGPFVCFDENEMPDFIINAIQDEKIRKI